MEIPVKAQVKATDRRRVLELDALRGIAALGVVLFHYTFIYQRLLDERGTPLFSFDRGGLGVYLFFIISGFVILMTLSRTKTVLDFAVSRVSRIYPAYWVGVIFTFAVLTASNLWPEGKISLTSAVFNLTMLQRFVSIKEVDGVYWTLQYEFVFYGIALALFMTRMLRHLELVCAGLLGLSVLYWIALDVDLFVQAGSLGALVKAGLLLVLIFQHIQYFVTGMMLFRCWQDRVTPVRLAIIAGSIVTSLIVHTFEFALAQTIFAAVIWLAVCGRLRFLASAPFVFLGTISYTLYLVHQNAGYVLLNALDKRGVNLNIAILITIAAAIAVASLITYTVEQPAMRFVRAKYKHLKASRLQPAETTLRAPAD